MATDYVTEKIYDCLLAGTVPIYLGTTDIAEFVPPGSYIDATAHGGPSGLAVYLRHLLERPDEYRCYLAWRDKPLPAKLVAMTESVSVDHFLRLLDRLPPRPDVLPAIAVPDAAARTTPVLGSRDPANDETFDARTSRDRVTATVKRLTPLKISVIKAAMVVTVWLVALIFMNVGWASPLLAVTATLAWLAGARWTQHFAAAAVVLAILVRIGAVPPPADWHGLMSNLHAPLSVPR